MPESFAQSSGDFEAFYKRNYKFVYRICFIYMKNAYDAEDCTEDTFVKALNGNYSFNDENHERAWLTVAASNLCKDRLKSRWRKSFVPIEEYEEASETISSGNEFETNETLKAVMNLPVKYKDLIILYYYQGYQTDEIAEMLKLNPSTVRNRLREARLKLKAELGDDFE